MTLEPGHSAAALLLREMVPGVNPRAYVYAPLCEDLLRHLDALHQFHSRPDRPTSWELDIRAGANWRERALREQPGNTAVIAGRNRSKIALIRDAVVNGLHVLADEPWVIDFDDFLQVEEVLREAELREVIARDLTAGRHGVTAILQRELVADAEVFGDLVAGSPEDPALCLEATQILRAGDGASGRLPAWAFDPLQAGEALTTAGPRLADLVFWLLFPDQPVHYRDDLDIREAASWSTVLSAEQYSALTGLASIPLPLDEGGYLNYPGNGHVTFTLKGAHVRLIAHCEYEYGPAADGPSGDLLESLARGSRARVAVRHGRGAANNHAPGGPPELTVEAVDRDGHAALLDPLARLCAGWQDRFPGVAPRDLGARYEILIPAALHLPPEALLTKSLAEYVEQFRNPRAIPAWERPNLLAKYYLATKAVQLAHARRTV